jgi:curved DNA-binding protein CbpA
VGASNPFDVLGLPVRADISDDDVRSAWTRIAASTHPDREDGGDPARYAAAADAYSRLRTGWERGEAYADLRRDRPARRVARRIGVRAVIRLACAGAAGGGAYAALGWAPATLAIIAGALTWLVLTGRRDIAAGAW